MLLTPDLTHADWWVRTTTKLLQKVDTTMRFTVGKVGKTQHLIIENISEATLSKLFFLVNTDQNNNYGYLESLQVFLQSDYSRTAIPIPGFSTLANAIWNEADATGFVAGEKTQTAFLNPLNNPYTNQPLSICEYVDWITAVIPWAPKTFGQVKIFTLMLNPDTDTDTTTQTETLQERLAAARNNNTAPSQTPVSPSNNIMTPSGANIPQSTGSSADSGARLQMAQMQLAMNKANGTGPGSGANSGMLAAELQMRKMNSSIGAVQGVFGDITSLESLLSGTVNGFSGLISSGFSGLEGLI